MSSVLQDYPEYTAAAYRLRVVTQATLALPKNNRLPAEFVALTDDKRTLLFAFPASVRPFQIHDKAITFEMQFSGIILKTPFEPKKMMAHGSLAM